MALHAPPRADQVAGLLRQCDVDDKNARVVEYIEGGNNTVYRISAAGRDFALKKYSPSKADKRDRLGTEWAFLKCAVHAGFTDSIPTPYAIDRESGLALYGFVDGRKLREDEITPAILQSAMEFIAHTNSASVRAVAKDLGNASEAEFSLEGHLQLLTRRLARLSDAAPKSEALADLLTRLNGVFERIGSGFLEAAVRNDIDPAIELSRQERCWSPSDFGFHNALLCDDGRLVFMDFEYAGWDDPAKLAADFFFQPAVPVDGAYYDEFLEACLGHLNEERLPWHRKRARLLKPLVGLRWCCIILNPFDPNWARRRDSQITPEELDMLCRQRIRLATEVLSAVERIAAEHDLLATV